MRASPARRKAPRTPRVAEGGKRFGTGFPTAGLTQVSTTWPPGVGWGARTGFPQEKNDRALEGSLAVERKIGRHAASSLHGMPLDTKKQGSERGFDEGEESFQPFLLQELQAASNRGCTCAGSF